MKVGTQIFEWEDISRKELFTETGGDFRKLVVQVWYPANSKTDSIYPYLDYVDIRTAYISKQIGVPEKMIKHINKIKANKKAWHITKLSYFHRIKYQVN